MTISEQYLNSDIVAFRQQQSLLEQAAMLGLNGYAVVSRHEVIEKRMEQGAIYLQQLMEAGEHERAFALMETEVWMKSAQVDSDHSDGEERSRA